VSNLAGVVTTRPDGSAPAPGDEFLYVVTPTFDAGRTKWTCRWLGGPVAVGDACVLLETDGEPWAVGVGGASAASVDALDARVDVLEDGVAFRAVRNAAASLASGAAVVWDAEERDTHGWFDTGTGLWTPQRAGIYRLSWALRPGVVLTANVFWAAFLTKNGATAKRGPIAFQVGAATAPSSVGSAQVELNGASDNVGVSVQHGNGGSVALVVNDAGSSCWFDGELVEPL
jgi:hypothetical protein